MAPNVVSPPPTPPGLIRALLYVGFIVSMIGTRTFPLFAAQSACLAVT